MGLISSVAGVAGVAVYAITKAACHAWNIGRAKAPLPAAVRAVMQRHFPELDLEKVRVCTNASLPANLIRLPGGPRMDGMALGRTIFLTGADYSRSRKALRLLMHELVHVEQVRRLGGEIAFARAYGRGYVEARGYRGNPLEAEAYEFESRAGRGLPDGVI
ncbi:MAG TPA: DUF4157 domain-containing protein [Gemmatimonadaceae bacterium]|nr:DUF4157 domain-containing protein [Gemmatimonadaceae bacterium]